MSSQDVDDGALVDRLAALGVTSIRSLRGGASSLTYTGTLAGDRQRRVVVKVAPAGVPPVRNRDVLRQARVLRALHATAVPVPEVLREDSGAPPDVPPLFVMEFVEGSSLEPLFDRHSTEEAAIVAARMRRAAETLGRLHALQPDAVGLGGEPVTRLEEEVDRWGRALQTVDPALAPGWASVADALGTTMPAPLPGAIVHGDFRLGNILAVGSHVAAVIDWEIWSVSDPRVDLGWFLVNADPATYRRATGYGDSLPQPADLVAVYGRDEPHLEWFQALALFKSTATWALIVKHNRRSPEPDPAIEEMVSSLPHLLDRARELI